MMETTMYTKVVVPLDGSPLAEVALPYAEEIAAKMSSNMVLLTVLDSEEQDELRHHEKYCKKIVDNTAQHVKKYLDASEECVNINTATRVGSPAEGILDF